jgi:formylglycine-generating enzyme required for sulfatase activity
MIGNVNEWVQDCYGAGYAGAPPDGSAIALAGCTQRVVRGGGWSSSPYLSRSASRTYAPPGARLSVDGFRLARDL